RKSADGAVRFLAETHTVSYVTQLELVDLLTAVREAPDTPMLAVANPDGSLPGASREVRGLVRAGKAVTALEGAEAAKTASSVSCHSSRPATWRRTACSTPSVPSARISCWPARTRRASTSRSATSPA